MAPSTLAGSWPPSTISPLSSANIRVKTRFDSTLLCVCDTLVSSVRAQKSGKGTLRSAAAGNPMPRIPSASAQSWPLLCVTHPKRVLT